MAESKLADHLESIKSRIIRPAAGLLPYPYIVPTATAADEGLTRQEGVYAQQYDWDCFFEGIALMYDGRSGAEALRDAMRNFLTFTTPAGFTPRTLSPEKFWDFPDQMKPFLAQGCYLSARALDDYTWLAGDNYRRLCANLDYWASNRCGGHGLSMWRSSLESGVDNNATTVNCPDLTVESVDVNAYLVREYRAMEQIARALGSTEDEQSYRSRADELVRRMNVVLWDDEDGCYYDVESVTDEAISHIKVKSWTCLTPLWAGAVPEDRAKRLIESVVLDEEVYWGQFGVPSLARNERVYNQGRRGLLYIDVEKRRWEVSNWQGPVWVVANWQIMHGLLRYGYTGRARELAGKIAALLERDVEATGGMHENYDAETGVGLWSPNFGSWNLLAARMVEEAETGYDPASLVSRDA